MSASGASFRYLCPGEIGVLEVIQGNLFARGSHTIVHDLQRKIKSRPALFKKKEKEWNKKVGEERVNTSTISRRLVMCLQYKTLKGTMGHFSTYHSTLLITSWNLGQKLQSL